MATTILLLQLLKDSDLSSKQLQEVDYEKRAEEQKNPTPELPMDSDQGNLEFPNVPMGLFNNESEQSPGGLEELDMDM
jgi:hypothetical protein